MPIDFCAAGTLANSAIQTLLQIIPFDFARYLIGAGGVYLLVNVSLAATLAGRKIRPRSPEASQMRREFLVSLRTIAIFAASGALTVMAAQAGFIRHPGGPSETGWAYFAFNLAALIVAHDAWFYWTHRAMHRPGLFRRFHRLHHRSHNPSPWTAYSFNVLEAISHALFLPAFLFVMPSSLIAIFLFLAHMMLRNAIGHCGYELFPARRDGRPVFDWMTTVTHHDLHHAQAGWNFGLYFTCWDRIMGTEHPLYHEKFAEAVRRPLDGSAVRALSIACGQSRENRIAPTR